MSHRTIWGVVFLFSLAACIQDDFLDDSVLEELRINTSPDTFSIGQTYQFTARYTNRIGEVEDRALVWNSSATDILTITNTGLATPIAEGISTISVSTTITNGEVLTVEQITIVQADSVPFELMRREGQIRTTSSYVLEGDFTVQEEDDNLIVDIKSNYRASSSLPGLYIYLTNNPNSIANAYEVGRVDVFNGAHIYQIPGIRLNDYDYLLYYCKPFNVKVGDGQFNN